MNKQNDSNLPDYTIFNREINNTSSPIQKNTSTSSSSSSSSPSKNKIQSYEKILNKPSTCSPKRKLNSYASTDEDVDEFNLDCSDHIDRSLTTIQTYRDKLNARLQAEQSDTNSTRRRITSMEYSQNTIDSGVDILSEQKLLQSKIDEQYSEETTNQNDLFALSDDSLLDIESPQINDLSLKPISIINEKSISLTEESNEGKSFLTAITDFPLIITSERGPSNTSEHYYSAESEFNTSLSFQNNDTSNINEYENNNTNNNDHNEINNPNLEIQQISSEYSQTNTIDMNVKISTFGDWIDQVFTTFLAETNQQQSSSTSRSSSIISIHTSTNTIDTSSSQVLTVIENNKNNETLTIISKNSIKTDNNNQMNFLHCRSQSWPSNEQQQQDEKNFKELSNSSLSNENIDLNSYENVSNNENINSINEQDVNKQSTSMQLSSIENNDEEVINKETMQNNYLHHHTTSSTTPSNTDQIHIDDENFSFSNLTTTTTNNIIDDVGTVEETEHIDDEKQTEIGVDDDNKNDSPLIQVVIPDESSSFSFDEEFLYCQTPQNQHTNSHDSLLQADHHIMNNINTAASSTDDLSSTNQLSLSAFPSKDSALGLSDDNLNWIQTKQSIIRNNYDHDDDDDVDDEQQEQQISLSSLSVQYDKTVDNNEIQDNANNNNIDKNEMLCEHNNDDENVPKNTSTMICINDQSQIIKPSNLTEHVERTISSSSSEQLIPKEKQTGMYYPAFGSSAAIHLAEKYHCEWLQDVTSPTNTIRKSSTIINDNKEASDSRIFHQNQTIGDDDEFYLSLQTLQPSYSCPNINTLTIRETQRQRSYSLTTLDAYACLDITRDTLEQMWLSLLDLAFSDKDDVELGEYKLRHIIGLSNSCTHNTLLEKSRSHGDIFSTTNENPQEKFIKKKSKSFDITSLPKLSTLTTTGTGIEKTKNDSANIGLLQGAAISEPFIDRIGPISSIQSDTENNLMDIDNDSIQSNEQDNHLTDEPYSPIIINQITSPVIKEPLNYIFHFTQQLENQNHNNNDDEYDLEPMNDISSYLPNINLPINQIFGDEDKQLCMSLGFDDDEATAALAAAVVQPRDIQAILADYRPHSLSTIPSSRESQYASSIDDSDDIIDLHDNIKNTIGINQENILQVDNTEDEEEEEEEDDRGEIESNISSSPSKPLSPIQSRSSTPSERNQQLQPSNFSDIDHDAWERSINEPIYSNDLSIKHNNNDEENLFTTYTDNLTSIVSIPSLEQSQLFTIDEIEPTIIVNESEENNFIEQTTTITTATTININNNLINFSIHEDYIENMDNNQYENKSTNSTRTSISSIHDTHLDPNELAYRLARLDSSNISSPPKKTLADELAELGERENHFENDSLDHTPPLEQESNEQNENLLSSSSLNIDQLTTIVNDIQKINQEKSISSLCTIIEDIHAEKNNQYLTKIVDYHHSPPISNLQTIIMELNQISMKKLLSRPQRPTHLELDIEEDIQEYDEQSLSPMIIDNNIPISSNLISNLEQNLAEYKIKSPSPSPPSPPVISSPPPPPLLPPSSSMTRRISDILPVHSNRYQTHRIDKVSDLEIVKQGKGFKIGYVDRQGTDQRVILTKRIQAGPDIMARDPHVRLPYKGRKILNQAFSSILYTNGYNTIQEDKKFERTSDDIEVPIIGTNPQHFDESDMVSIDIDGPSTMLNSICESIVITQGSVYTNNSLKSSQEKPLNQSITRNIFDNTNNNFNSTSSSRLRHVVLDQHEEYLLDTSHTPTPTNKKDKIEIIDTWQDHTIIDGSSTTWRSPSLHAYKATKHIEPSNQVQTFISTIEPNLVQMRIAPSHDIKYRTSEHIEIPSDYNWNDESSTTPTPIKHTPKTTRDMALSPILIDNKTYKTSSTSPIGQHQEKIDRSCQYSPPIQHDFGLQCYVNNSTTSTQVSSYEIPNFLLTYDGIQTIHDINQTFDDSGIQTHIQTISPSLSIASSDHQQSIHTGKDFIRKLNDSNNNNHASALTITQYTDDHYYLPTSDNNNNNNNQTIMNTRLTTLERSADSGILVDEQLLRNRRNKANFALQVDIKGSSSDSEDVSEVTRRPFNRIKSSINDDMYEHHSELIITAPNSNKNRQHSSINNKHLEQSIKSAKEIEQQILQLRRERAHILELLSLNWSRSNIWVELTEAKLNYIIGETDALLRSLSFDTNPIDSERVKLIMHQYEEDMAELTRQRLAVYRERLENSKKQLDMKIDELELKKSTLEQNTSHYSTLEYMPRVDNVKHSKSFLSTSAENLSNMPLQDSISSHPHLLDISFLTSTPSNQTIGLPPRYPRSPRLPQQYQSSDTYRTVYRPTPRYPSTITTSNDQRYDYPRYRTTSYVTPNGNLSGLQGLSKSQQAILDETDKLVKDSQELHNESASQFERARESLLSSEASIRLARANMAASRYSPNSNYLPNDVTLAELFKYEQSLAKETAKNTRAYSSLSTSAES
ncbi:unnamed protein product [Rotaria sp. Silwood1]|nr:unnamed protein product [Rotaria sp. Silwood1]